MTLTGTNFASDYYPVPTGQTNLAVNVSGSGVTVTNLIAVSATSLTCNFVIAKTATVGTRSVTVSHTGGTSGAQTFTIGFPSDFMVFFS